MSLQHHRLYQDKIIRILVNFNGPGNYVVVTKKMVVVMESFLEDDSLLSIQY